MKFHLRMCGPLLLVILCMVLAACGGGATSTTASTPTTAATAAAFGRPSTSFQLTGLVRNPGTFALAELQALPKVSVMTNTQPLGQHTFAGALLYDLLQKAGIVTDASRKNDILRKVEKWCIMSRERQEHAWGGISQEWWSRRQPMDLDRLKVAGLSASVCCPLAPGLNR